MSNEWAVKDWNPPNGESSHQPLQVRPQEIMDGGRAGGVEYNGLFLPKRKSRVPWSDLLCQVWGSQQLPSLLCTRKCQCFLIFITITLYILDVCRVGGCNPIPAQVFGPREIPSDLTEMTAYHLEHVNVAEYRSWIGLCFNSLTASSVPRSVLSSL